MQKTKYYYETKFPSRAVEEAHNVFLSELNSTQKPRKPTKLAVSVDNVMWDFDSREEFLAEYPCAHLYAFHDISLDYSLVVESVGKLTTSVSVAADTRSKIEAVFSVFERYVPESSITVEKEELKVFIGHGRDAQWRDLKDHLQDQHGIKVIAYETGPRAGLSVKEVLERMVTNASFAFLVLTGEDMHSDGEAHARENVIHELGLFQGRLRFTRAIALLEDGVHEFSNILGVNQIRFGRGRIRETFGDVVATIRREFTNE
jgi:predicted nucleotide-binding protein